MGAGPGTGPVERRGGAKETAAQRRRRLDEVFGDDMPDTTSDERDPGGETPERGAAADRWLREQVPPHHG